MFFADTPSGGTDTTWSQNLEVLKPLIDSKNYTNLIIESKRLSRDAFSNNLGTLVLPLEAIAFDAQILNSGKIDTEASQSIKDNYNLVIKTANREATSTETDRVRNEDLIWRKLDSLEGDIKDFKKSNLGMTAIWNKLVGGIDLSDINNQWVAILQEIMTTPLTAEGKERLLARHQQMMTQVDTHIIKMVGGGTILFLSIALLHAKLGSILAAILYGGLAKTKEHLTKRAKKAVARRIEKAEGIRNRKFRKRLSRKK